MALIAMAVYDTEENKRTELTRRTLEAIRNTVDLHDHEVFVVNNNSCHSTKMLLQNWDHIIHVIHLRENVGTAEAINIAWAARRPGQNCVKMDNDVDINTIDWVEDMEEVIRRNPEIGQVGLKRKDCWEYPTHENPEFRSELIMTNHKPGERWLVVERCKHIMGTCVMHSAALLDKVGYLYQPGLYGYDDVLMSWRSHLAGFINVHMPHIDIDHIDPGDTPYQDWKHRHSGQYTRQVSDIVDEYISGKRSIYYEPQAERV